MFPNSNSNLNIIPKPSRPSKRNKFLLTKTFTSGSLSSATTATTHFNKNNLKRITTPTTFKRKPQYKSQNKISSKKAETSQLTKDSHNSSISEDFLLSEGKKTITLLNNALQIVSPNKIIIHTKNILSSNFNSKESDNEGNETEIQLTKSRKRKMSKRKSILIRNFVSNLDFANMSIMKTAKNAKMKTKRIMNIIEDKKKIKNKVKSTENNEIVNFLIDETFKNNKHNRNISEEGKNKINIQKMNEEKLIWTKGINLLNSKGNISPKKRRINK